MTPALQSRPSAAIRSCLQLYPTVDARTVRLRLEPDRVTRCLDLTRDELQQAHPGCAAHLAGGLANGCQRNGGYRGELDVVVPDHRDVLGHPHPPAQQAVHHTAREVVVRRDDAVGSPALGTLRDPGAHRDAALQGRALTPHQLEAHAGVSLHRLPGALQPLAHLPHLLARAEEGEPRPAE